jgi:hypothetical protein
MGAAIPPSRGPRELALVAALLLLAGSAAAQSGVPLRLEIMVTHASSRPGPVDPGAAELHRQLRQDFRYESLRVLQRETLRLRVDEIGKMKLPNGRWVRVRPLNQAGNRLLMAVEVEGSLATDLRLRNHRRVSIGSHRYKDGTLVITFKPDF